MSKLISIRTKLYEYLTELKGEGSFSTAIGAIIDANTILNKKLEEERSSLQETTVTQEGRISKTLAGKTILYKVKE